MKKKILLPLFLIGLITLLASCNKQDNPVVDQGQKCKIVSYNEFGGAMLDVTVDDLESAGFYFGDVISLTVEGQEYVMPFYDGYYARNGEFLCVGYFGYPSICFTRNDVGLPKELMGLEGHAVTIKMKQQGGCDDVQEAMSMQYYFDREEYDDLTDAQYANARVVTVGNITKGRLYRSSSPFSDEICRAFYVSEFLEQQGVKSVLNLADSQEKILSYDMPPYSRTLWESGNVILCPLKADCTADNFNKPLIEALKEFPSHPAPYLVHCIEGKDRTGYVCALLEGLCGATYEEIVADYLVTYYNYFGITPANFPEVCSALVVLRLHPCLMHYSGVTDESQLPNVDYAKAFASYLLTNGMTQQQLDALINALTAK